MDNFTEFCSSTSLHAWNRLPGTHQFLPKSYWLLVIFGSFLLGTFFVYENVSQFQQTFSTISVDTTTGKLNGSTYPRVVICKAHQVRLSFLDQVFNRSVITNDDSGYDIQELQEAFVKHFITGYKEEEGKLLKPKVEVVIEKYIKTDHFNETMMKECIYDESVCSSQEDVLKSREALLDVIAQDFSSMILQYDIQEKRYYSGMIDWNADYAYTDIGWCIGLRPKYIGLIPFTYDPVTFEEEYVPQVLSGPSFGVDVLLDAETYDNGDISMPFKGFTVAVSNDGDTSLMGLNGFTVSTGTATRISAEISIHRTTDTVLHRFSSEDRNVLMILTATTYLNYMEASILCQNVFLMHRL